MRFGIAHRVMISLVALICAAALMTSGLFSASTQFTMVIAMLLAVFVPSRWQRTRFVSKLATLLPLVLLTIQLVRIIDGAPFLPTTIEFALFLQVIRVATRKGAAHDQQIMVLAWLHLISGTVLGQGLVYGLCFLALLVVMPGALVLSHLRREVEGNYRQGARDRSGLPVDVPRILRSRRVVTPKFLVLVCLTCVPILVFTVVLFVAFPRMGQSLFHPVHDQASRMIGFSDKVNLGGLATLHADTTVVLRVQIADLATPAPERISLYLRGTFLDQYAGGTWSRSARVRPVSSNDGGKIAVVPYFQAKAQPAMTLDLEPIDPPVIFVPPNTAAIEVDVSQPFGIGNKITILEGPDGELRYISTVCRPIRYHAFTATIPDPYTDFLSPEKRAQYLSVPADMPKRVRDLALSWTADARSSLEKATAISNQLKMKYAYDLHSPSGSAHDPLDDFLFESKRGHCEYFSTAMAMMLRVAGIPSRNVTGFIGGTYNRFGKYYTVRQGDAHSWVEAYIDGVGWSRFDPTPAVATRSATASNDWPSMGRDIVEALSKTWDQHVVRYSLSRQLSLGASMRSRAINAFRRISFSYFQHAGKSTIIVSASVAFVVLFCIAVTVLWFHRRRVKRLTSRLSSSPFRNSDVRVATLLYEKLQNKMRQAGVPRDLCVPPLKHANMLKSRQHPCADAIAEVTHAYLKARFGDEPIDSAQRKHLEKLIQTIKPANTTSQVLS